MQVTFLQVTCILCGSTAVFLQSTTCKLDIDIHRQRAAKCKPLQAYAYKISHDEPKKPAFVNGGGFVLARALANSAFGRNIPTFSRVAARW